MPDTKISALTDGTPAVATDEIPINRAGSNFKLLLSALKAFYSASPAVTGTMTVANATLTQQDKYIAQWAIPFIFPSSFSMGNNGAISGLTALPTTYSGGAWMWMATGQIAAGSVAGWYWFVASSTTAGTLYNSTYTTGTPGLGTQTAFVTTGPGAATGVITEVTGPIITVPASAMGLNGALQLNWATRQTSNANVKTVRTRYSGAAGTQFSAANLASRAEGLIFGSIANRGVANAQYGSMLSYGSAVLTAANHVEGAIDTSVSTTIVLSAEHQTATDNFVIESGSIGIRFFLT